MRKLMAIIFFCFTGYMAQSQKISVEGTAPNLYINHIVAAKENFYSIARLYNQSPKLIASFNKIVMEKGLTIGQHIKVPLTAQNYDNTGSTNEKSVALTHTVAKSETLFRIGSNVNVAAESLRKWNKLSSDRISPGTPLIIGFLKTDNAPSPATAAKNNKTAVPDNNSANQPKAVAAEPKETSSEAKKDAPFTSVNTSADKGNTTETEKPAASPETVNGSKKNNAQTATEKDTALAVAAENPAEAAKEESAKQQENLPVKKEESKNITQVNETGSLTTGTFEEIYAKQASQKSENTKSGEAATFKSTSGWQDKKYYVLINDITPGTIVKISSADKSVYAKVLGSMPEMKENTGLLLRISNAAASNLGIIDPKFSVQVSYYQ